MPKPYKSKHYRLKAETGYLGQTGYNMGMHQNGVDPNKKPEAFSYLYTFPYDNWKFGMIIPYFKNIGFKKVEITRTDTNEVIFSGLAFTFMGETKWKMPRENCCKKGLQYKITISR